MNYRFTIQTHTRPTTRFWPKGESKMICWNWPKEDSDRCLRSWTAKKMNNKHKPITSAKFCQISSSCFWESGWGYLSSILFLGHGNLAIKATFKYVMRFRKGTIARTRPLNYVKLWTNVSTMNRSINSHKLFTNGWDFLLFVESCMFYQKW